MIEGLQKRLITSAVLVSLTLATIFFAPKWLFFLVIEIFSFLALMEFLVLVEKKGIAIYRILALVLGVLLPYAVAFSLESAYLALTCLILFTVNFQPKARDQALVGMAVTIFGLVYVVLFFSQLIKIRDLAYGHSWVFYTILLTKGGDAFAYFVGKKFGKKKLIEHISPNKSVEGALGQFGGTILLSMISKIYLQYIPFSHLIFLGAVLGVLSQLGDLAESLIKRDVGVKDSGQIPGLGGVLDVLDSLLLTIPFVYYYLVVWAPVPL